MDSQDERGPGGRAEASGCDEKVELNDATLDLAECDEQEETDDLSFWQQAEDDGSVVQHSPARVAIYINCNGDLCVRQERTWCEEYDPFVVIARGKVQGAIAQMDAVDRGEPLERTRAPLSGAERMRRHRQRHRDASDEDRHAPSLPLNGGK
jgi:hypothetical protein